jgi:hypothetical protein
MTRETRNEPGLGHELTADTLHDLGAVGLWDLGGALLVEKLLLEDVELLQV